MEWVLLADGVGQDSRGAVTAIGLNQDVLSFPSLPAAAKRAVVAHLTEGAGVLKAGDKFSVMFKVTSPSDKVIVAQSGQVVVGQVQWPDLPVSTSLPVELAINFSEYGTHRIEVTVQAPDGGELNGHVDFYVVKASPQGPSEITVA